MQTSFQFVKFLFQIYLLGAVVHL